MNLRGVKALAFDVFGITPPASRGAAGFWMASTAGLWCAGLMLTAVLLWMQRTRTRDLHEVDTVIRPAT